MQPQGHVQVGVLYFLTHHVGFGVIYIFYNYATHSSIPGYPAYQANLGSIVAENKRVHLKCT